MTEEGKKRITIIGLGLIGGSLGLALKKAALNGVEVVGHSRRHETEKLAERMGAIDRGEHNLHRAVEGAGLVIIATPVLTVREVMEQIAGDLAEGAVVTDAASTKSQVMKWAQEFLPEHASFVGGHPMAGKEKQGIENADADLFRDRVYCICPAVNAAESAVKSVVGMARVVGSEPMFIDPEEHDVYAAAVSHLPLMVSAALFNLLRTSPSWNDMSLMASSGLRDTTRLASGDPRMAHDIWVTNREAVIHWLERMEGELRRFRDILQDSRDQELLETFAKTQIDRDSLISSPPKRLPEKSDAVDKGREALVDMLIGRMTADRLRKMAKFPELMKQPVEIRTPEGEVERRPSFIERASEDLRRDLEKLEQKRAEKEARKKDGQ